MKAQNGKAQARKIVQFEVDKGMLLKILDAEEISPSGATKIIATGHRPEYITFTVAFD